MPMKQDVLHLNVVLHLVFLCLIISNSISIVYVSVIQEQLQYIVNYDNANGLGQQS